MRAQLRTGLIVLALMTVLLGVAFPLAVTGIARVAFPDQADGSLVEVDGQVVGSALIGQDIRGEGWFHPRPSAAGYDGASSGASNLGPSSPELRATVAARVAEYRDENDLAEGVAVPVDAVTASGSGLDPHISVANARLQAPRVAAARGLDEAEVLALVAASTEHRPLGVLGDEGVNVLLLDVRIEQAAADR